MRILPLLFLLAVPTSASAEIRIVATLPDLAALAAAVAGPHASVTALAAPTEDPHYVDPRPSLILPLNRADLLVLNGLELEIGWLPRLLTTARNARIQPGAQGYFDASASVRRLGVPDVPVDRSQGDVHAGGNPHFTLDPRAMAGVAGALAERLAQIDAAHASDYRSNAARLAAELEKVAAAEKTRFAALPEAKRRIVVYHQSLDYLLDWLGLAQVQAVEPRPGIPPNPSHVSAVLQRMRSEGVHVIVQEEHHPRSTSETLAKLAEAKLAVIPTGTRFANGESYVAHIKKVSEVVHDAVAR